MSDTAPCVWCRLPTIGRNPDLEPLCGDFECQRFDYRNRNRLKEAHEPES